jgi:hypothetical protein
VEFSVTANTFNEYLADIQKEGDRAKRKYGMRCARSIPWT